jgi:hypothetical protein
VDLGLDLLFAIFLGTLIVVGSWVTKQMPIELRGQLRRPFFVVCIVVIVIGTAFWIWSFATYRPDPAGNLQRVMQARA